MNPRKITLLALALLALLCAGLAEDAPDYDHFRGAVDGRSVTLGANGLYSYTDDGCVRLDFFAFVDERCVDLFVCLPPDVRAGDVLTEADAAHPGLGLTVVLDDDGAETVYSSYAADPRVRFAIAVETADVRAHEMTFAGTVEATLALEDGPEGAAALLRVESGRFTIRLSDIPGGGADGGTDGKPSFPAATLAPGQVRT